MAEKNFSLKDQLFNADTLGQLADEYAAGLPGFDRQAFLEPALAGIAERTLVACIEHFADCVTPQLAADFLTMADQVEAMMPPPLDPTLRDDDFGHFIHAVPGVLAVRHGLEAHTARALDLLKEATKRFSMELSIRAFLNERKDETLERMRDWCQDDNYHVRRLCSEGTRPKLPWAKAVDLAQDQTLPILNTLHADPTRFVTRSVANHLNDIAKTDPAIVVDTLTSWRKAKQQEQKELAWMTQHALRTLVKQGDPNALKLLGYRHDAKLVAKISLGTPSPKIGDSLDFSVTLEAPDDLPILVDYRIGFARPSGRPASKVYKLKQAKLAASQPLTIDKRHKLKDNATTFQLHAGTHSLTLQVNGKDVAETTFELRA